MTILDEGISPLDLVEAIKAGEMDGYEISNHVESWNADDTEMGVLLHAIAERCCTDPTLRQDLIDFDALKGILKRVTHVPPGVIRRLIGNSRDAKMILNETHVVDELVERFCTCMQSETVDSDLFDAITCITTGCNDNKVKFIKIPKFFSTVLNHINTCPSDPSLFRLLTAVVSDDDKQGRIPAPVFARETLVDSTHLPLLCEVLSKVNDTRSILNLVRELSVSQDLTRKFAIDEHFLAKALHAFSSDIVPAVRYFRQISFSDEMKDRIVSLLLDGNETMSIWIETSRFERPALNNLFGTLANLCLKSPELATKFISFYPKISFLCMQGLDSLSAHDQIQCLSFLRCLVKTDEGSDIVNRSFRDRSMDLSKSSSDSTVRRIAREITSRTVQD